MTGAPVPAGATAVVPVEATDGATDTVADPCDRQTRPAHPPRRRGRHRGHHGAARGPGRHTRGARPGRRAGHRRADGDSAPAGAGDVDRLGAGGPRHAAAARPDLRVQRGDARRRDPRGRRARWSPRRWPATTSTQFRADAGPLRRTGRPDHHHRRCQRRRLRGGQGRARRARSSSSRSPCSPVCRRASGQRRRHPDRHAARQPGQRAGVVRGVHPVPAARGDGAASARPAAADGAADRVADLTARQAAVPPRRARRRERQGHQLRPAGVASPALAGVGELSAGDRRRRRRGAPRVRRCWCGTCRSASDP